MTNGVSARQASAWSDVGFVACQNAMDACEGSVMDKSSAIICVLILLKKQIQTDILFVKTSVFFCVNRLASR
jgi:hypothetical protein